MQFTETQMRDYRAMLHTRHQAAQLGIPAMEPWPPDKAARLMAIVQIFGNNECFTLSTKFNIDRQYIQELYGIDEGQTPDENFAQCLREWVSIYILVKTRDEPVFVSANRWIEQMYNFKIFV